MKSTYKQLFIFLPLVFFTTILVAQVESEYKELQSIRRIFQLDDYYDQVTLLDSLNSMEDLEAVRSIAYDHINKGKVFLLLSSGLMPNINATDIIFENKYDVYYYDYGCVSPSSEIIETYNAVIFCHLTNTYGSRWMTEIRTDVPCIQSWAIRE